MPPLPVPAVRRDPPSAPVEIDKADHEVDEIDDEEPPGTEGADPQLIDATYSEWKGSPLPEPTATPVSELLPGQIQIVKSEGPLPAHRAC
jgi:hypothetical protein